MALLPIGLPGWPSIHKLHCAEFCNLGSENLPKMKNTLLLFLALCSSSLLAQVCNPGGNVLIYTNYDGGDITIDIDEDIPDIRIGICSYESISIEITGDFVDNVTQVLYAGYDDDGTTSISGVPSGITDILLYPPLL